MVEATLPCASFLVKPCILSEILKSVPLVTSAFSVTMCQKPGIED